MALQPVATVGAGAAILSADVVSGTVVGAQLVVPPGKTAVVEYLNGTTVLFQGTFSAGTHNMTLATNKRFTFATSNTRLALTMRWP